MGRHQPDPIRPPGMVGSFFLFFRSYTGNSFLSPLVRIQEDRKQRVVSTGVYGFVWHPMYLGAILMFVGTLLLLGSYYGLFPGFALTPHSADLPSRIIFFIRWSKQFEDFP
jgi:protein-S-isoprenylcysteine O-methyltransferase Ste14